MQPSSFEPTVGDSGWNPAGLLSALGDKRVELLAMRDQCGKNENSLADSYYTLLEAQTKEFSVAGLFGWNEHKADRLTTVRNNKCIPECISECKKVTEHGEYGFWHALIQAAIYRHQTDKYPVVCTVFDWGRKAGKKLETREISFLFPWVEKHIYFIRISLAKEYFIEHNLLRDWQELR